MNTQKICNAIAEKINSLVIDVNVNTDSIQLENYDLIGFGSGIDSGKHYSKMLEFVNKLPNVQNKKAFVFSTSAIYSKKKMVSDHKAIKELLENKGFVVINEFSCKGFNTNSILKYFGGMNKNHPNDEDIKNARIFAEGLLKN
jgi:flavodoxin